MPNHVHLLVRIRPNLAPSVFIQKVKANSSKWINQRRFFNHDFTWQIGGAVFSIGYRHIPYLIKYIDNQKEHHRKDSFKNEYLKILVENNIEFSSEYLLDFHE